MYKGELDEAQEQRAPLQTWPLIAPSVQNLLLQRPDQRCQTFQRSWPIYRP